MRDKHWHLNRELLASDLLKFIEARAQYHCCMAARWQELARLLELGLAADVNPAARPAELHGRPGSPDYFPLDR